MMNYQKLTFEDIMQPKILYFDEEVKEACINICETLKIDNMPDYDSRHYWEFIEGNYCKMEISPELRLNTSDKIFDLDSIEKLKKNKHNVLFVFSGNILKGIVHFADYNRNIVLKRIQDDVLHFETNLRELLVLHGKTNNHIISYYQFKMDKEKKENKYKYYKGRYDFLTSKVKEMKILGAFQLCNLKDLMDYCSSDFSGKLFPFQHCQALNKHGSDAINDLRNMVMHGKNPIEKDADSSIYSIESLERFRDSLLVLVQYQTLLDQIIYENDDYQRALRLENQNKLNIIHHHHPNALKYFIGY